MLMKLFIRTSKKILSLAMLMAIGSAYLFSQDRSEIPGVIENPDFYKALGEEFHRFTEKDKKIRLLPKTEHSENVEKYIFADMPDKIGYASEALFYVTKDDLVKKSKKEDKSKVDTSINTVSKIVRSISQMKGMLYYSNTRKRYEVLYNDAYRITDEKNTAKIQDDLNGSANGKTVYAMLDEHTFGKAYYKIQYQENDKCVTMTMENLTSLSYKFIKALKPGKLKMAVTVYDTGDGYFVYVAMLADFKQMGFLENKMNNSFTARIRAIKDFIVSKF